MSDPQFTNDWCKLEGITIKEDGSHVFTLASTLINRYKNFSSALHLIFGLSWHNHRDYLHRCKEHLMQVWTKDQVATEEWLQQFVQYYITEVEQYPQDG
jgi:hypothetical protein